MQSVKNQKTWEDAISLMRFPLMCAVVFIHTSLKGADSEIYTSIRRVISTIICGQLAVPLFFFISGFLFFYNVKSFSWEVYIGKIKRRIRTLLIPYLFWNFAVLSAFWCAHTFLPTYISADFNNVPAFSWIEILRSFWDKPGVYPICYQFWFLRNLIIYCLLAPIVYWTVKVGQKYVAWIFVLIPFFWNEFFFYFCIGAFFSLMDIDIVSFLKTYRWYYIPLCIAAFLVEYFIDNTVCMHLFIWSGMAAIAFLACCLVEKGKSIPTYLTQTTFWLYAVHGLPIVLITTMILPRIFNLHDDCCCLILFFVVPAILIAFSIALYYIIKQIFPGILALVTGNRK